MESGDLFITTWIKISGNQFDELVKSKILMAKKKVQVSRLSRDLRLAPTNARIPRNEV